MPNLLTRRAGAGRWLSVCVAVTLSISSPALADRVADTQAQLDHVSAEIRQTTEQQEHLAEVYQQQQQTLEQLERRIGELSSQQHHSRAELKQLEREQQSLKLQQRDKQLALSGQQTQLARQLRAAYRYNEGSPLAILLGEHDSAESERLLGYWQVVNRARQQQIEQLSQQQAELDRLERTLNDNRLQQIELVGQLDRRQQLLRSQQQQQQDLLADISLTRQHNQRRLTELSASQQELNRQLKVAIDAVSRRQQSALSGLASLKKQLNWPVSGRIRHKFGHQRVDSSQWSGVMLSAKSGSEVQAIHHGEVIFANWLRGYGLVIVLDHGGDYLSLYAHNQSLLHNVGDRIQAGQPIALVGNSGGESEAGLYFEVRHRGQAVDPAAWCRHG